MNVQQESQNVWYLDSGCNNHTTRNHDIFVELDQDFASQVKLGDGKLPSAEGKGVISVRTKGGNSKLYGDVLYVSNLTQNLLSVGQLLQKGYSVIFDGGKCKIFDKQNNVTVAIVEMSRNKYFDLLCHLMRKLPSKVKS